MREDLASPSYELMTSSLKEEAMAKLGRAATAAAHLQFADHIHAYTSRTLTFSSDILNAFAGLEEALSSSMNHTKMWYGMPASAFDWALLWTSPGGGCYRPAFPTWSWAGWDGQVTMAIAKDESLKEAHLQQWLQGKTWIKWHITLDSGKVVPVWDGTPRQSKQTGKLTAAPTPFSQRWVYLRALYSTFETRLVLVTTAGRDRSIAVSLFPAPSNHH